MPRDVYLALGDSITYGYNASRPERTYAALVHRHAARQGWVAGRFVLAQHLWTAQRLLAAASSLPSALWARTSFATVMIGGNDLRRLLRRQYLPPPLSTISPDHVTRSIHGFAQAFGPLCRLMARSGIPRVVLCTIYNPVPHSPLASGGIDQLNDIICTLAKAHGFTVADVHGAFSGHEAEWIDGYRSGHLDDLISPIRRPIHPNDQGHAAIARCILDAMRDDIRVKSRQAKMSRAGKHRQPLHNDTR
ncbi:SGNH/GDSL hydrolase family protein [Alicyclobacillus macrosporangiidus]|uniref:Lysophospholipase L1 n=1 Tax=Alicyclobacillus macrosporangiidus TaxID=392015 RepID=A0A1I7JDV7_9BACL|nr:SGNH/GDSL hydrolase family protein [Alicyclobacillus macrosporangiidus]SFU83364.1 Lysophospholipase L1 [Alicyclobacillus macrosporangiidus]